MKRDHRGATLEGNIFLTSRTALIRMSPGSEVGAGDARLASASGLERRQAQAEPDHLSQQRSCTLGGKRRLTSRGSSKQQSANYDRSRTLSCSSPRLGPILWAEVGLWPTLPSLTSGRDVSYPGISCRAPGR